MTSSLLELLNVPVLDELFVISSVVLGVLFGFIIFVTPLYSFFIYIHEFGHILSLRKICKKLNLEYNKSKIIMTPKPYCFCIPYKRKTYVSNDVYKYLIEHSCLNYLKSNAKAGMLFTVKVLTFFCIMLSVLFFTNIVTLENFILFLTILVFLIFIEIVLYLDSSDYRYFKNPKTFTYKD